MAHSLSKRTVPARAKGVALAALLALGAAPGLRSQALVPAPARMVREAGAFTLGPATRIEADGAARPAGEWLRDALRPATGLPLPLGPGPGGAIRLTLDPAQGALGSEGYQLKVWNSGVLVLAAQPPGLFHGLQTLRQLLPAQALREARMEGVAWTLPAVTIQDGPRFPWRGSHLDASRHFLPKSFLKKHLDLMALHKLNVFHWHLTDDQGWRLQIRRYPLLTQVGARRKETVTPETAQGRPSQMRFDNTPHEGFYTQEDVREIVRYAADRFITVVPEIEMPGHCAAALAAYPELGNRPERPVEPATSWGVFETVFNVEDATLAFLKQVLDEVLELFPSPFIHIGGDECPKAEWAHSERALDRMKREGLVPPGTTLGDLQTYRDPEGRPAEHPALRRLQSWFIHQLDAHLTARGRRLIGWDEILEGGLAPGAAVMSWRGEAGGIEAARAGHDVVMTPQDTTYFSQYQSQGAEPIAGGGLLTLEQVYAYDPIPGGLAPDQQARILGTQGQLWTEFVAQERHAEYMLWPRLAALAEGLWSPAGPKDFPAFHHRLHHHLQRLEALDVHFHPLEDPAGGAPVHRERPGP